MLTPLRCWLGRSSSVARLTKGAAPLQPLPARGKERCPQARAAHEHPRKLGVLQKDRATWLPMLPWRWPTLLLGARPQFSGTHGVAGDGRNSRFQNKKKKEENAGTL